MRFAIDTHIAQRRIVRPFLRFVNTVPIDPTNPFGARVLARALADGDKVCIFPEGRITVTGGLMKITGGPGMLADQAKRSEERRVGKECGSTCQSRGSRYHNKQT